MRASARRAVLLTAALGAACVTRTRRVAPSGATATALGTPDIVQEMARQALILDAKGDRAADTLYAPEALVVANARVRLATPRFAGAGRRESPRSQAYARLRRGRRRRPGHRRGGDGDPGRPICVGARGLQVDQFRAQPSRGRSRHLRVRAEA